MAVLLPAIACGQLNVPTPAFPTIQSAIVAAVSGDTVVVANGVYNESLDFMGKLIIVRSAGGPASCTIDGDFMGMPAGTVVRFENGEGRDTELIGFTITSPLASTSVGISCDGASPTIRNCVIRPQATINVIGVDGNASSPLIESCEVDVGTAATSAIGVRMNLGLALVDDCNVHDAAAPTSHGILFVNTCAQVMDTTVRDGDGITGAGIKLQGGTPRVGGSIVLSNMTSGIEVSNGATAVICSTLIAKSEATATVGVGVRVDGAATSARLVNCTVAHNNLLTPVVGGAGIRVQNGHVDVSNCIVWGNGEAQILLLGTATASVDNSDVEDGFPGLNVINLDPLFVDPANDDFHVQAGSPVLDAGEGLLAFLCVSDCDGDPRIGGSNVDMGCDEFCPPGVPPVTIAGPCGAANPSVGVPVTHTWTVTNAMNSGAAIQVVEAPPGATVTINPTPGGSLPSIASCLGGERGSLDATSAMISVTWTPQPADLNRWFRTRIKYRGWNSGGQCVLTECPIECLMLIGSSPLNIELGAGSGDFLLTTVDWFTPVLMNWMPTIPVPPWAAGYTIYVQIGMINGPEFPNDPLQMSNGLALTLGQGSASYGTGSGILLWEDTPSQVGQNLDLAFWINAFGPPPPGSGQ
ncbi:MAG: hypothetical protein CMJ18_05365 [Phycisphaeraceae bacterium]|nr:hypothetical protein [Phycisphaeraceae bacterium]